MNLKTLKNAKEFYSPIIFLWILTKTLSNPLNINKRRSLNQIGLVLMNLESKSCLRNVVHMLNTIDDIIWHRWPKWLSTTCWCRPLLWPSMAIGPSMATPKTATEIEPQN